MAAKYPINVALHTDHCPKDKLDTYVRPLIAISRERVDRGENPLFQSHMWDGSAVPLDENLKIAADLLEQAAKARIVLEIEVGVVGGEEDGVAHEINEKLYTTPADYEATVDALGVGEKGRYLLAATFGNVHGVYKPGNVQLRPSVLKTGQETAVAKLGLPEGSKPFDLVFHGGSGSLLEEIHEALSYGVVKMNVDTDTQYAFTRPIVEHMFKNYDGVLKIDGEVGNKKVYDPRSYMKKAELGMAERVAQACEALQEHRDEPRACEGRVPVPGRATRIRRTMTSSHGNLLGPEPTRLPVDPGRRGAGGGRRPGEGRRRPPRVERGVGDAGRGGRSPTVHPSRRTPTPAPATTAGWTSCGATAGRASGPCRGRTSPTVGFLRALAALHRAAAAIGELDEAERTSTFLAESDAAALAELGLA